MPSQKSHEEEANTTLRRKATDLARQKWPTRVKVWIGVVGSALASLAIIVSAVVWFNGENAWAGDVKRADAQILLNLQQTSNASRYSQVSGDIDFLEYRQEKNGELSSTEKRRLASLKRELARLETEKEELDKIEIELLKKSK